MDEGATAPWWREDGGFFGELYKEADDSFQTFFHGGDQLQDRTAAEVDGVERLCGLRPGDRVLDCPCGYGRHSIALAQRGYDVVGADINERFLSLAKAAAAGKVAPQFVTADMRALPQLDRFDAVINMFYSFGFFTAEEDVEVARGFWTSLKPGGRFLMHTIMTVPAFKDGRIPREERRALRSGRTLISKRYLDETTKREYGEWSLEDASGEITRLAPFDVRIYDAEEFQALCVEVGFQKVQVFGGWDGRPYEPSSPALIVVATK